MFSLLSNFQHSKEVRESKDEVLVGEIVRAMARLQYVAIGFVADMGLQSVRFRPLAPDSVLNSVLLQLDRKTGGNALQEAVLGNKAVLTFQAEVKNFLADPDDLVKMYRTDLQNIFKIPMLGDVRLNHQLNSVFATKKVVVDIDTYIFKGEPGVEKLMGLLTTHIGDLMGKLAGYKKK